MANKILVLAPHTDDGELGCGGAIARFLEEGAEIWYTAFSTCEESVPTGYEKDKLARELMAAMKHFGIPEDHVLVYHFPVRHFPQHRQEILEEMVKLNRSIGPDLVFAPSLNDVHQDHQVIANETVRAFKKTSILGYEEPWNNLTFQNQVYILLDERHVRAKAEALECYESQKGRDYTARDYIFGVTHAHGVQIGRKYAEVFETVRWIV